jgi:hypothetical protein
MMTNEGDWQGEIGQGGSTAAGVRIWREAIVQMRDGKFPDNPSTEKRSDRIRVYQWQIAALEGRCSKDAAWRELARSDARWFLDCGSQRTEPPKGKLGQQFIAYMQAQDFRTEGGKSKVEKREQGESLGVYKRWYEPIEAHQRSCERAFLMLARFGTFEDADTMEKLMLRGNLINDRLTVMKDRGILTWLPCFFLTPGPNDQWWHEELFGRKVCLRCSDITIAWQAFRNFHQKFMHRPAELIPKAAADIPPVYGNFGERDDDEPLL